MSPRAASPSARTGATENRVDHTADHHVHGPFFEPFFKVFKKPLFFEKNFEFVNFAVAFRRSQNAN